MKNIWSIFNILTICFSSVFLLSGCEDDEVLALAKAQKCLDEQPKDLSGTNYQGPIDCAAPILEKSSQQASIIKCAAYLMGGGLDTNRIVEAAKKLDDAGTNQESVFIGVMTLNKPDADAGRTRSSLAQGFCNATGVGSYIYLSSMAAMGTALSQAFGDFPADPTNLTEAELQTAIMKCNGDCVTTIANSAQSVASNYCNTASEDDDVCKEVNNAITASNGDSDQIGNAMLCFLEGKTWANNSCN